MAVGQQHLGDLDALLGDRLLQHVEVAARIDGGALHGLVAPDDGAVLLERGDGGDHDLEHRTRSNASRGRVEGRMLPGVLHASAAMNLRLLLCILALIGLCRLSRAGPDRRGDLAVRPRPGRPLRGGRRRHRRDPAGPQRRRLLVSRLAHQDDDDLHRLRGTEGRPPHPRHAHGPVGEWRAPSRPPSSAWGPARRITVEQGLQALVARSANDVATGFGELISGSEAAFAVRMTETAARIGMNATQFRNANGLPDAGPAHHGARHGAAGDGAGEAVPGILRLLPHPGIHARQDQGRAGHQVPRSLRALCRRVEDGLHLRLGLQHRGQRGARRAAADRRGASASAAPTCATSSSSACSTRPIALKTGGNRPKIWQIRNGAGRAGHGARPERVRHHPLRHAGRRGLARHLSATGARRAHAYDVGQADIARLGFTRLGKEWILPVTSNKVTKQAAIIADLEPAAAQKLCADYQARKLFCEVKKPQEFTPPFGRLLALTLAAMPWPARHSCDTAAMNWLTNFVRPKLGRWSPARRRRRISG